MNPILFKSDWGGHDEIAGTPLNEGDRIRLRWPDGIIEEVDVRIVESRDTVNDHGHGFVCVYLRAYTMIRHHGVKVLIQLVGIPAELISAATQPGVPR